MAEKGKLPTLADFCPTLGFILWSRGIPSTEEKYDRRREIRQRRRLVLFDYTVVYRTAAVVSEGSCNNVRLESGRRRRVGSRGLAEYGEGLGGEVLVKWGKLDDICRELLLKAFFV